MGLIKKQIEVYGSKGKKLCKTLFDSGASTSFIREDIAKDLSDVSRLAFPMDFTLGDKSVMRVEYTTDLQVRIEGHDLIHMFSVNPKLSYEMIIGADFLQRWKIRLDPVSEDFIIDEEALKLFLV